MAEDDIYGNKANYENLISIGLKKFVEKGVSRTERKGVKRYYCKNPKNKRFFSKLKNKYESRDLSYIRRIRLINSFKLILFSTSKDLAEIEKKGNRNEIDNIISNCRKYCSPKTMTYIIADLKYNWKIIYPVKDEKGRIDEKATPYVVRHLSRKLPAAHKKRREDRITPDVYMKIIDSFEDDPRMQLLLSLIYSTFTRPQELLQRRLCDVKILKNYSTLDVSSHGKEGTKKVLVAEANPYLLRVIDHHPQKTPKLEDNKAYLFITMRGKTKYQQMTTANANKILREKLQYLKINKKLSLYSFKRNGITDSLIKGESPKEIQTKASWTSTNQLATYDIADDEEVIRQMLIKKGLVKPDKKDMALAPTEKQCPYCSTFNPLSNKNCVNCKRLLWVEDIEKEEKEKNSRLKKLEEEQAEFKKEVMRMLKKKYK